MSSGADFAYLPDTRWVIGFALLAHVEIQRAMLRIFALNQYSSA